MECPKCNQPTMWNPYINNPPLYICYNIECNYFTRIEPKEDENMKKRYKVGLNVYAVMPEGILKGIIVAALKKGQYSVQTFLGNITLNEGKVYPTNDFGRACNLYRSLYGDQ